MKTYFCEGDRVVHESDDNKGGWTTRCGDEWNADGHLARCHYAHAWRCTGGAPVRGCPLSDNPNLKVAFERAGMSEASDTAK